MGNRIAILAFALQLLNLGCSKNVTYYPPVDILLDNCQTYQEIQGAKLFCNNTNLQVPTTNYQRALVVLVEPGTLEANRLNSGPFSGLVVSSELDVIAPHFRILMSNLVAAYLEKLQASAQRYSAIYVINSGVNTKAALAESIQHATAHSTAVDLFLIGHGSPGVAYLNPNLDTRGDTLSADEIVAFAKSQLGDLALKVKSVFMTFCYSSTGPNSLAKGFRLAFPRAGVYGTDGLNFYPLHRDFVALEEFQKSLDFVASVNKGNTVMSYNTFSGTDRRHIYYPSVKVRACADLLITEKCVDQVIPLTPSYVSWWSLNQSQAILEPQPPPLPGELDPASSCSFLQTSIPCELRYTCNGNTQERVAPAKTLVKINLNLRLAKNSSTKVKASDIQIINRQQQLAKWTDVSVSCNDKIQWTVDSGIACAITQNLSSADPLCPPSENGGL